MKTYDFIYQIIFPILHFEWFNGAKAVTFEGKIQSVPKICQPNQIPCNIEVVLIKTVRKYYFDHVFKSIYRKHEHTAESLPPPLIPLLAHRPASHQSKVQSLNRSI